MTKNAHLARLALGFGLVIFSNLVAAHAQPQPKVAKPAFTFAGKAFVARYSQGDQHEFTPTDQPDLQTWTEMITINDYRDVKTGENLASKANAVLEIYKKNHGTVVRTNSIPRSKSKPAEHLIVVMFPQKGFVEVAFARFLLRKGLGASIVYSHREYGANAGDAMAGWLLKNGDRREKELMAIVAIPKH